MNLSDYTRMPKSDGDFLKWKTNGETKILRFLYTSHDGSDIEVVQKKWDDEQKKYVYDTPDGKLTCVLNAVLYESGQPPKKVRWERSAAFTEQVCNGYWAKFPRIIDGVWEVTCTNPGTKEIKFSWFPIMGADFTNYPLPEGIHIENGRLIFEGQGTAMAATPPSVPENSSASEAPAQAKKYWE